MLASCTILTTTPSDGFSSWTYMYQQHVEADASCTDVPVEELGQKQKRSPKRSRLGNPALARVEGDQAADTVSQSDSSAIDTATGRHFDPHCMHAAA